MAAGQVMLGSLLVLALALLPRRSPVGTEGPCVLVFAQLLTRALAAAAVADASWDSEAESAGAHAARGPGESDEDLDLTDAHLALYERQMRMRVCMELAKSYTQGHEREVRLYIKQMSDRLDEHDANNYLMHSLLVNCYHAVRQEEVENFGTFELSPKRLMAVMTRPENRSRLRLSSRQLEVLNGLLIEDGATGTEIQLLGVRFSELPDVTRWSIVAGAAAAFVLPLYFLASRLLCPGSGQEASKSARGQRRLERRQERLEQRNAVGGGARHRR